MYCFAPILEVAKVFEMTPLFPTSGQKNDCTCIVISTLTALMKAQLENLSNKTNKAVYLKDRDKIGFGKNIESGQFEMNLAGHITLVQRNKSIDLCIRRCIWSKVQYFADPVILWQALFKRRLIYHYEIPNMTCMISHIRHYIKHMR